MIEQLEALFVFPTPSANDSAGAPRDVQHDDVKPKRVRCESQADQMPASRSWESPKRSSSSPPQSMRLRNRLHMRRFGAFR
ncbi:MAG: hypothetical protein RIS70_2518 [Planctomycetota bacterium]